MEKDEGQDYSINGFQRIDDAGCLGFYMPHPFYEKTVSPCRTEYTE